MQIQISLSINKVLMVDSHAHLFILSMAAIYFFIIIYLLSMAAFTLKGQSWVAITVYMTLKT